MSKQRHQLITFLLDLNLKSINTPLGDGFKKQIKSIEELMTRWEERTLNKICINELNRSWCPRSWMFHLDVKKEDYSWKQTVWQNEKKYVENFVEQIQLINWLKIFWLLGNKKATNSIKSMVRNITTSTYHAYRTLFVPFQLSDNVIHSIAVSTPNK